jgi:hypothetical protein
MSANERRSFMAEATLRAYANQEIANVLGVPYAPGTVRMPFRQHLCDRGTELAREVGAVAEADKAYRELCEPAALTLPVFLAVALSQAGSRDDVWARLATLRAKAGTFRTHRADLDAVLAVGGRSRDALRLKQAVHSDAMKLSEQVGAAVLATGTVAGFAGLATVREVAAGLTAFFVLQSAAANRDAAQRAWWRMTARHLYFLSDMRAQSQQMTNSLPTVSRLWDLPNRAGFERRFKARFESVGGLRTT